MPFEKALAIMPLQLEQSLVLLINLNAFFFPGKLVSLLWYFSLGLSFFFFLIWIFQSPSSSQMFTFTDSWRVQETVTGVKFHIHDWVTRDLKFLPSSTDEACDLVWLTMQAFSEATLLNTMWWNPIFIPGLNGAWWYQNSKSLPSIQNLNHR